MEEKTGYEHVATIYNFAKEHGYKVQSFNTSERRNKKGAYNYVEVALVVPCEQHRTLKKRIEAFESDAEKAEEEHVKATFGDI